MLQNGRYVKKRYSYKTVRVTKQKPLPWVTRTFTLTEPNPRYDYTNTTELHQHVDQLGMCPNLT
jgi:hypothetical protein